MRGAVRSRHRIEPQDGLAAVPLDSPGHGSRATVHVIPLSPSVPVEPQHEPAALQLIPPGGVTPHPSLTPTQSVDPIPFSVAALGLAAST